MTSRFHPDDVAAVAAALSAWEQRCENLLALIGEKRRLTDDDYGAVTQKYLALKDELKEAAKSPYIHEPRLRRDLSPCESAFNDPAVRKGAIALRPPTNSNPIKFDWFSAVYECKLEFSYFLHNLISWAETRLAD